MAQPPDRRFVMESDLNEFEARTTPAKRTAPDGANLDLINKVADIGAWQLTPSNTYVGLPAGMTKVPVASTLELAHPFFTAGLVHRLTIGETVYTRSSISQTSWRPWVPLTQTRGTLPDGTNADEMYGPLWSGTWHIAAVNTYLGLPEELEIEAAATLSVLSGNSLNATTHMLVQQTQRRLDMWVRELDVAKNAANPVDRWHGWKRIPTADEIADLVGEGGGGGIVRSAQATRLVLSTNPEAPLENGDVLFVYGS